MSRRRSLLVRMVILAVLLLATLPYARSRYISTIYLPYPEGGKRLFCDLNADGDMDIIVTRSHYPQPTETVYWHHWRGRRRICERLPINQVLFAADMFLVGKDEKGQVVAVGGTGRRGVRKDVLLETSQVPAGEVKARGGDLDRDGQCDDVVIIPRSGQELWWFERQSDGSWHRAALAKLPLPERRQRYSFVDAWRAPFLTVQAYPLLNAWNVALWEGQIRFVPRRTRDHNLESTGLLRHDFDGDGAHDRLLVQVQEDKVTRLPVSLKVELESTRHKRVVPATIVEQGWYLHWASFSGQKYDIPLVVMWRNLQKGYRICEYVWSQDTAWTAKRQILLQQSSDDGPYVTLVYADGDEEADLMVRGRVESASPYPAESLFVAHGTGYQMADRKRFQQVYTAYPLQGGPGYCQIGKRLWVVAQMNPMQRATGASGDLCFLDNNLQLQRVASLKEEPLAILPSADGKRVYIGTEWSFEPPQLGSYRLPLGTYRGFVLTVCEKDRCTSRRFTLPVKSVHHIETVRLGEAYHQFPAEPSVMRLAGKQRIYVKWKHGDVLLVAVE